MPITIGGFCYAETEVIGTGDKEHPDDGSVHPN
jgi:hypothetical protein